jgi:hypothetical protein
MTEKTESIIEAANNVTPKTLIQPRDESLARDPGITPDWLSAISCKQANYDVAAGMTAPAETVRLSSP